MPCSRWNSYDAPRGASSSTAAMLCALWVANCGNSTSTCLKSRPAQAR